MTNWDSLWLDGHIATFANSNPYGVIKNAAIAVKSGRVAWIGPAADLPIDPKQFSGNVFSLNGAWVTPGLIDSHTHLVYAGNRAHEFEMRLKGMSYAQIAQAGGGIRYTVQATRDASEEQLFLLSKPRLQSLLSGGVTTVEIKSGYGLDLQTELKMLRVARRLAKEFPVTIRTTFLGLHTIPKEFSQHADMYVDYVLEEILPAAVAQGLVDAVDAYCETIAFSPQQVERLFIKAQQLDLPIKLHAEQLSDSKGALLAANYRALSADHLEYITEEAVCAMADAKTVAILLPGAYYFLQEKRKPPLDLFRQHGVPIALATDCNPGTSPITSLLSILNMATVLWGMTPEETLYAVTKNAATALGIEKDYGTLEVGKIADFVVWNIESPAELAYYLGLNLVNMIVKNGRGEKHV